MKLLEATKQLDKFTIDLWYLLQICLEARRDWLEEREPESSGMTYDTWEAKYEDWNEICELCGEIISKLSINQDASDDIADLAEYILDYHYSYGGISRLRIE